MSEGGPHLAHVIPGMSAVRSIFWRTGMAYPRCLVILVLSTLGGRYDMDLWPGAVAWF